MSASSLRILPWLLLLAGAMPAHATQLLYQSPAELGAESALVIQGKVESVRSYWDQDGRRILTEVEVEVDRAHKGAIAGRVRVVQAGGVVDGVRMSVHGALAWNRGEEVLLFLEPSLPQRYRVAGFSQGKYSLQRDDEGRVLATRAPLGGAEFVGAAAAPAAGRVSLSSLLAEALPTVQQEDQR